MNKKLNTVLFLIGAFIVSCLLIIILLVGSIIIASLIFGENLQNYTEIVSLFLILISVLGSFFIYTCLAKWFSKKVDMNKYFTPIFKRKR